MDDLPFRDAAEYYDPFRPPYAPQALAHVASGVARGARVLDLGCGPGTLAIPLSHVAGEVVAIDADAAMIAEGRRLAQARGAGTIRWVRARAEDALAGLGRFDLVTLGQSLHWMDRDAVLAQLATTLGDGGRLVILDEGRDRQRESWDQIAGPLLDDYLGPRERHPRKHPEVNHEPSLRRSTHFSQFTVREFPSELTRDPASILGCIYSSVRSSKTMFAGRIAAFEAELLAALDRANPSGVFRETLSTAVYEAPRLAAATAPR